MSLARVKIYRENWLLIVFTVLFTVAVACFFILDTSELSNNSRSKEIVPLGILLLAGILFAPVLEELAFRAAFIKQNIYIGISVVLMTVFVLLTYENYYAVAAFVVFILAFSAYKLTNSGVIFKLVCISNPVLFGLVHYKMEDFTSIERGFIVLFQISIGFLLIWITLNYGLVRSMIVHGIYNAMALSIVVYGLQFPDTTFKTYEDDSIKVEWQAVPYFESIASNFTIAQDSIITKGVNLPQLYPSLAVNDTLRQEKMIIIDPYTEYNFRIILKENAANRNIDLATETFLLKEKFIIPNTGEN